MKVRYALIPATLAIGLGAYIAFHPGVAYAEPRMAATGQPTAIVQDASYTIDPMHTSIYFEISHMGLANIHGRINKFTGKIVENSDVAKSSVEFTAEATSIDTGVVPRDNHLRSADFFEVEKFPLITFKSTKISKTDTGYLAEGDLTIKGATKKVSIPFKRYGPLKGTGDQPDKIGVIADPIKINRRDFNNTYGNNLPDGTPAIGNEVTIRVSLEANKDK